MFLKFTCPNQNFVSSLAPPPTPSHAKKAPETPLPLSPRPSPIGGKGSLDVVGGWLSVTIFAEKESSLSSSVLPGQALCIHGSLVQTLQREADDVSFRQRLNVNPQNPSSPPFCLEPNPLPGVQADGEEAGLNQIPNDGSFQTPPYTPNLVHMRSVPRDSKTLFLCKTKFKPTLKK